jgi:hypothetical protein
VDVSGFIDEYHPTLKFAVIGGEISNRTLGRPLKPIFTHIVFLLECMCLLDAQSLPRPLTAEDSWNFDNENEQLQHVSTNLAASKHLVLKVS